MLNCLFSTLKLSCCCCVHSFVHFFQLLLLSLVAVALMLRRRLSLSLSEFVCIPPSSFAVFFFFGICKLHKLSWTINYGKIIMDCCFGVCVCERMQFLLLLLFLLAWLGSVLVLVDFFFTVVNAKTT